jgi:molybdopterin/thiamine biosynthesis adenylyltransferase
MLTEHDRLRYARHLSLPQIGEAGQEKLKASKVALIGLGGLGSPISLYLAAAGVGHLLVVDPDVVSESNLQRQVLHSTEDLGIPKIESAVKRLGGLNPGCHVETAAERLTPDNAQTLLKGCDLLIDASDNYAARFAISDASCALGIPFIYGAVRRFEGQVALLDPAHGTACYRCLFPSKEEADILDRESAQGLLGAMPGMIGATQSMEALKFLAGIKSPLYGSMLSVDTLTMRFRTIPLRPDPECQHHEISQSTNQQNG